MINSIKGYSFIDYPMHGLFKDNVVEYIQNNLNKTIFEFQGNLFDLESLSRHVNLDCLNCRHAHTKLCCNGSPYAPIQDDIDIVESHLSDILRHTDEYQENNNIIEVINDKGLMNETGSFTDNCGRCIFSIKIPGADVCSIHAYALANDLKYTSIKPKSCLMYPLDMIEFTNGKHFIFGINEETVIEVKETNNNELHLVEGNKGFSRWNNTDLDFVCVNKEHRRSLLESNRSVGKYIKNSLPNNMFKIEDYRPIYENEKEALISLFGEEAYQFINKKTHDLQNKEMKRGT